MDGKRIAGRILCYVAGTLGIAGGLLWFAGGVFAIAFGFFSSGKLAGLLGTWYVIASILLIISGIIARGHGVIGGAMAILFSVLSLGNLTVLVSILGIIGGVLILSGEEKSKQGRAL